GNLALKINYLVGDTFEIDLEIAYRYILLILQDAVNTSMYASFPASMPPKTCIIKRIYLGAYLTLGITKKPIRRIYLDAY
ncbi:MAG: hypothetical protein GY781_15485, partial [Gammaproteobacteria bacterium]|nr:hypothetical protein [Gammaproteobacteria bacterium]